MPNPADHRGSGPFHRQSTPLMVLLEACHRLGVLVIFPTALPRALNAVAELAGADARRSAEVDRGGHPRDPQPWRGLRRQRWRSNAVDSFSPASRPWRNAVADPLPFTGSQCLRTQRLLMAMAKAGLPQRIVFSKQRHLYGLPETVPSGNGCRPATGPIPMATARPPPSRLLAEFLAASEDGGASPAWLISNPVGLPTDQWPHGEDPRRPIPTIPLSLPHHRCGGRRPISRSSAMTGPPPFLF